MSSFQVNITPTRTKDRTKNEGREPTTVVMAPFSAKAIVTFEDIPVTKTARRILKIFNPSEDEIEVFITKFINPEFNVAQDWTSNIIPSQEEIEMQLVWSPQQEVSCKETIHLVDSRNFKKDVMVIFKSVSNKPKGTKRFPNITSNVSHKKTFKVKSPNGKKTSSGRQSTGTVNPFTIKKTERVINEKPFMQPLLEKNRKVFNYGNESLRTMLLSPEDLNINGKENISPMTPSNVSSILEKIQFTPATSTIPKEASHLDYLASLPTPIFRQQSNNETIELLKPRRLCVIDSPEQESFMKTKVPEVCISYDNANGDNEDVNTFLCETSTIINNKTFDLKSSDKSDNIDSGLFEDNHEYCRESGNAILNKTTIAPEKKPRNLSMIHEEVSPTIVGSKVNERPLVKQSQFNLKRDVEFISTPMRKFSESMNNLSQNSHSSRPSIQGSMPNLNGMEKLESFEQNRYFNKCTNSVKTEYILNDSNTINTSIVSNNEFGFNQHEILAQSSRFNLHEIERPKIVYHPIKESPKLVKLEVVSPRYRVKRLCDNSSINSPNIIKSKSPRTPRVQFNVSTIKRTRSNSASESPMRTSSCLTVPNIGKFQVSPPKKPKVDSNPNTNYFAPATNIRIQNWSRVQPKRFKLQLVKKNGTTPNKIKVEPRVDLFMQSYINPDPFAATTTCDPFLSSTMYLDERAIDKHETEIKKWLNALVSMPVGFDPDCEKNIDLARIFNEAQRGNLTYAPTKEEQSVNYLTESRLASLRKAARELYHSAEMHAACDKVVVQIKNGGIKMQEGKHLDLDVVMQRYVLDLLLCFNPLWLRIGLETVLGENINLVSNSDVVGLTRFILSRFFRDTYLKQKYSKPFLAEKYSIENNKFTFRMLICLLMFLDKAKSYRIIKHNPCLFVKTSKYKEVKEILLRFASEFVSAGDILKNLKRLGYELTHKQKFIDEYNYAFKNLGVDLRDGIRLTKVMEIMLLRDDLTKQLRAPAISRLQRVFNVNLALKALSDAEFELKGNILAADIVDGHREKTLSLLWQIIYKFRAPKFNAAATILQDWWRKSWLKVYIQRRILAKHEAKRNKAATIIQSAIRGYFSRKYTEIFRWERTNAVICLQKYVRRYIAQRKFLMTMHSILYIQHWYRTTKQAMEVRAQFVYIKHNVIIIQRWYRRIIFARKLEYSASIIQRILIDAKLRYEKAIIIQKFIKSITIRRRLRETVMGVVRFNRKSKITYLAAAKLQSFFKSIKLRKEFIAKRIAIIKIQKMWQSYKLTKKIRNEFLQKKESVIKIQKFFRNYCLMKIKRQNFLSLKSSVTAMQKRYRANQLAKLERQKYLSIKSCIINVQRIYRANLTMKEQRQKYMRQRKLIKYVQQKFRAKLSMEKQRNEYHKLKLATIKVQRFYRSRLEIKKAQLEFNKARTAIICIQRKWRATLLARQVRFKFVTLQYNTIIVQQRFRANCQMKKDRDDFKNLKEASINIQRRYRANELMKSTKKEFEDKKKASIVIQRIFRSYLQMKICRAKFRGTREAIICIQQRFREYLLMKKDRQFFVDQRRAAIIIQRQFRALQVARIQQKQYQNLRLAVILIQNKFRSNKLMQKQRGFYLKTKISAITIQRLYRAKIIGRKLRNDYQKSRACIIRLQQRFRANILMKQTRISFLQKRQQIISIQRYFRGYLKMKQENYEYNALKTATIKVQQRFRSIIEMRKQRAIYMKIVSSVICIQQRVRATIKMQQVRAEYMGIRNNIILFQRRFRSYLQMKKDRSLYLKSLESIKFMQIHYRAKLEMLRIRNQYLLVRSLIICIQRKFRGNQAMKIERNRFLELKVATIYVQRCFRSKIETIQEQKKLLCLKKTALGLQSHCRGYLARNRFEKMRTPEALELLRKRMATVLIQRFWRGYRIRKKWNNVRIRTIRKNIKELSHTTRVFNTVQWRVSESVRILGGRYSVTEALSVLNRLDWMSRTVPHLCMGHSDFISSFCYGIMAQAIRSEVDKHIIELCSRVILNLARYNSTTANTFQESGLTTVAQMLLRWCDKDCEIFITLCTLIWVFAHCPVKRKKIREFMTTPAALFLLRETKKLVARKENMKKNVRKPSVWNSREQDGIRFPSHTLPILEADYGVIRNKPYTFISPVCAFDTILNKLNIEIT